MRQGISVFPRNWNIINNATKIWKCKFITWEALSSYSLCHELSSSIVSPPSKSTEETHYQLGNLPAIDFIFPYHCHSRRRRVVSCQSTRWSVITQRSWLRTINYWYVHPHPGNLFLVFLSHQRSEISYSIK